ncbi:adenosylcobinamide-GDP ribazoletransferase [Desulfobacula sp.]|uniref:adenosylcobinamide-GDP ribazoletransferase n=1 Tax=Desulfobacula sp. TaxID=2593537 RepID=UPI0025BEDA08|nr:adenosylcobinamide-GDP ribazoletransferase [Desulfobacula sp.]MBC2704675.1 adenosylcobinamide-GDP ribazoletransferase [Desulfobacula sp.]
MIIKKNFTEFRSAILFITILPAGKNVAYSPIGMIKYFPVVGLILGGLLLVFDVTISYFWPPLVVAVLDVIFLVVVTGAFHLDGLGDTADGLFSHRSREKVLEIMKDSRTGMMGLVAVFCILAVKIAGIYSVKTSGTHFQTLALLLIVPAYSRSAMIFGIRFLDYGREKTGTGLDFFEKAIGLKDFSFVLIPVIISLFLGYKGLVLNLVFLGTLMLVLGFYKKKLNCITGDMLGALNEIMEAVLFLATGALIV